MNIELVFLLSLEISAVTLRGSLNYFFFLWSWHGILKHVKFSLLICTFSVPCEELQCAQCQIPEGIGRMLWNWICSWVCCGFSLAPPVILNWTTTFSSCFLGQYSQSFQYAAWVYDFAVWLCLLFSLSLSFLLHKEWLQGYGRGHLTTCVSLSSSPLFCVHRNLRALIRSQSFY